jgi:hypothetical protein
MENQMLDMSPVIVPRSDQISADDFLTGPRTYSIQDVSISPGTEQPIQIALVGENRVWKPCKSMARVLVAAWGPDAKLYSGKSVTLYRDPKVKWGGLEVGGVRISHMSHIDRPLSMALTATKGRRADYTVKPLIVEAPAPAPITETTTETTTDTPAVIAEQIQNAASMADLVAIWKAAAPTRRDYPEHVEALTQLKDAKKAELQAETEEAF